MAGYGNPPTESQFQPGRSGNPAGKPKGAVSFARRLEQMFRDNPADRDEILARAVSEAKQGNFSYFSYIFDRQDGKMATVVKLQDEQVVDSIFTAFADVMTEYGWMLNAKGEPDEEARKELFERVALVADGVK